MLAYVDTSVWILLVEGMPEFKIEVKDYLNKCRLDGWYFCISKAVIMEALYYPYHHKKRDTLLIYDELFSKTKILPNYPNLFSDAMQIMKKERLKAMDSIHLAIASHHDCEGFISMDTDFKNIETIRSFWIDLSFIA